jgi:hypothetical protein
MRCCETRQSSYWPKPTIHETGGRIQLPRGATPKGGSRRRRGLCSRGLLADCDFNRAALHPAYPIKCRTSTQRTQAPESVDTPKSLSPLDPIENGIRLMPTQSFPPQISPKTKARNNPPADHIPELVLALLSPAAPSTTISGMAWRKLTLPRASSPFPNARGHPNASPRASRFESP